MAQVGRFKDLDLVCPPATVVTGEDEEVPTDTFGMAITQRSLEVAAILLSLVQLPCSARQISPVWGMRSPMSHG
jgi:hypothetical protein